ncbi:MAG TPA: hypothetical protein VKS25_10695 [Solirubrobacteraceae bacterium]|nr:hypothetical protein [Solirubrobacteraceae bacterium]
MERTGLVDHLADHFKQLHPDGAAAFLGGRLLDVADRLAEQIGGGDPDVAPTDVAADDEARLRTDDVCDRFAPTLAAAPAGRADEALAFEPADRGRDRGL